MVKVLVYDTVLAAAELVKVMKPAGSAPPQAVNFFNCFILVCVVGALTLRTHSLRVLASANQLPVAFLPDDLAFSDNHPVLDTFLIATANNHAVQQIDKTSISTGENHQRELPSFPRTRHER